MQHVGLCLCLEAVQLAVSVESNARILEVRRHNDSAALKLALPATGWPCMGHQIKTLRRARTYERFG